MGGSSRSRILPVLGLLLALIGGAWWLLRGEDAGAEANEGGANTDASAAALGFATSTITTPEPAGLAREEVPERAAQPDSHSPAEGFLVNVVDEATRTAIAGAEVMWLYPEQWLYGPGHNGLHFGWARESAPRVLTGPDGIAVLPHLTGHCWIGACTTDASGGYFYYPAQASLPLTIALKPEIHQSVRVEDLSGNPVAGACVGLLREKTVIVTATTDAVGMAMLRDLQTVRTTHGPMPTYSLSLVGPSGSEQRIVYEFDAPPAATPVLRIAIGGEVEILLQDGKGQPLTGVWPVQLRVDDLKRAGWAGTEESADALILPAREGRALFPQVALDRPLQAALRRGEDDRAVYARFAGPRTVGERVTAVIQLKDSASWIAVRVLGPEGENMPGLRVLAQYRIEFAPFAGFQFESVGQTLDSESRLHFEAIREEDVSQHGASPRRLVKLSATNPRSGVPWSARRELTAALVPGLNDIGELRLERTPLIVEGCVRRSDGRIMTEGPSLLIQQRDALGRWGGIDLPLGRSDADGRFRIEGRIDSTVLRLGELRIVAFLNSGATANQPFELGATGVEVVLDPTTPLTGNVLLEPEIPPRAVALEFKNEDFLRRASIEKGAWSLSGLPDGIYTMSFLEFWSNRTLWRFENLAVTSGKPADASVLQVDLRGKIRPIRIEVVDPEGQSVENWQIRLLGGEQTQWRDRPKGYGDRILSTGAPLDFDLQADRFARFQVRGVVADQRITLPRGIAVRVAILSPSPLPDDLEYGVSLYDEAAEMHGFSYLDASGTGEIWVPAAGTYHLVATARGRNSDRSMTFDVRLDAESRARQDVVIPAEGIPSVLLIGLDVEDLENVRKRLDE